MLLSRAWYYLSSIPTLVTGIEGKVRLLAALLRLPGRVPFMITLRASGFRFIVRSAMDAWIIKETCLDREYETLSLPIQDGWTVVDIGASLGDFALLAASGHPNTVVYAYEPFPGSFELLERNIRLNRADNVRTLPHAVGSREGSCTLDTSAEPVMAGRFRATATERRSVEVQGTTLDRIFADLGLTRCDYLKIDCEGGEFDILFSTSAATLDRIDRVCLEYHDGYTPYSHHDLELFFRERGFAVRRRANRVHPFIGLLYARRPEVAVADDGRRATQDQTGGGPCAT